MKSEQKGSMNKNQAITLLVGASCILLCSFFPPREYSERGANWVVRVESTVERRTVRIDASRLLCEIGVIGSITVITFVLFDPSFKS